ncbi:MAG: AraC family transcriptional regulator [Pikeienuella sp.]
MDKQGNLHTNTPLASQQLFQTGDLDQARDIVARNFCSHRLERQTSRDQFDAAHHRAEGLEMSLNYIRYGAEVEIEPGELGSFYLIQIPLSGSAHIRNGKDEAHTGTGIASVLNPHRHTAMRWGEGCEQLLLQIDRDRMSAAAETLIGRPLYQPVLFQNEVRLDQPGLKNWLAEVRSVLAATECGTVFSQKRHLTQRLIEEELITRFLRNQPSNIAPLLNRDEPKSAPYHVRRARRFIRENSDTPITMADVAAAAGVTPRSLQMGFRTAYDMTPMQYLQRERLNQTRFDLLHGDPAATVTEVAQARGFAHMGRFSAAYKTAFGEGPSETVPVG